MPALVDLIGHTPLVPLRRRAGAGAVCLKLEGRNPGGSVKDRAAWGMVQDALASGALRSGTVILDSTSGNTGIALAMIGASLRYAVELVVPENLSMERRRTLRAYGATLHWSDPLAGSDGAILRCREIHAADPGRYWKADQYNNPANPAAHAATTGPEIWRDTDGRVTHFVAAIGTSGTVMGVGRYLKAQRPGCQVIGIEPDDAFHGLEGMKHIATAIVPGIYDAGVLDRTLYIDTERAYAEVRRLARDEGLLCGPSTGAAAAAAQAVADEAGADAVVVAIAPDGGTRYLSGRVFDE